VRPNDSYVSDDGWAPPTDRLESTQKGGRCPPYWVIVMGRIRRALGSTLFWSLLVVTAILAVQSVRSFWKTDIITYYVFRKDAGVRHAYRFHFVSMDGRLSFNLDSELPPRFVTSGAMAAGRRW
jgi:hypothetical protein